MAQFSFEDYEKSVTERASNGGVGTGVGFFSLKDDGDEAIIRIMYTDPSEFECMTVHSTMINGKYAKVNCLRENIRDDITKCPMCESGNKAMNRFYVHLIQYEKDDNGNIVANPKVWERSISFASTIKSYINEYGPLTDVLFKVKRNGAKGSMQTTYSLMVANPKVYSDDLYIKVDNAFDGYTSLGRAVANKTYEEMSALVGGEDETPIETPVAPSYSGVPTPPRPQF